VCVARHLRFTEGTFPCNASLYVNKTFGCFLEFAIIAEIGKETDDSERRCGVIRGSFPAFSVMDWTKQRNAVLTGAVCLCEISRCDADAHGQQ